MNDYGMKIHNERRKRRISQANLAIEMGVARATLIEIEYDRMHVSEQTYKVAVAAMDKLDKKARV